MSDQDDVIARYAAIASAVAGHGDLDEALRDFARLPETTPGRARLAAGLVETIFRAGTMPEPHRARALPALLAAADTDPPGTAGWRRTRTAAEILMLVQDPTDPRASLEVLEKLAAENAADPGLQPLFASGRMALRWATAIQDDDPGAMSRLPTEVAGFLADLPPAVAGLPEAEVITRMAGMLADRNFDPGTIRETLAKLPPDGPVRAAFDETSPSLDAFAGMLQEDSPRPTDEQLDAFVAHAEQAGLGGADRALMHSQAGMAAMWGGREDDPARIALGIGQLRRALETAGPHHPQRVFFLGSLATALLRRHENTGAGDDLRETKKIIDEAHAVAGGPHHPQWQIINEMRGQVDRMIGERPDFHLAALDGLRGTVWQVLVQPDLGSATAAVRTAGDQAIDVARQCLAAGDPAAAITALDSGRGLALFAATVTGSLTERLVEAGAAGLAERWRVAAAAGDPAALSADLRRDVMKALSTHGTTAPLLDPPGFAEIQQALTYLDADALVYLVPGEKVRPGHAVIAPASGPPSFLTLMGLTLGDVPNVDEYLSALAKRDLEDAEEEPVTDEDLAARLEEVGRWAWDSAMRPLVETYLPRLPAPDGRPPRIVLIPMGELSRIPWQAARRADGRYAVELIALSQAASARMLVHSAVLPAVPHTATGLIIGDPDTPDESARPLPAARIEAYAIRQTFYPGARYLGRRPDGSSSRSGRGTADEVRAWLVTPAPAAGGVLHLACHGLVRSGGDRPAAYLQLAADRGDGKLTADELVTLLGAVPDRHVGLVVLAACRTGLSLSGYDEAYSLGTAFLAGGARTVLSSQWNVPDSATSALMFMVHRHLRVAGRPAWAALRDAQLWMLDPDREIPPDMPTALRDRLAEADLGEVAAWAAFIHGGQ
ncbi:CHAT domain-containing protein [Actinoplanes utahensis]|uniref:CHAT domain-containing protein n=1 Tax=Actinoplanes utahensis TaxID=1869 RepID=UPI00068C38FD|nr:CHAT domain-containing protein [Actinoplanes utahensis]GIF33704.1 hypothetical protein Aut01nite_66900 [Actinoplanes utahensis]